MADITITPAGLPFGGTDTVTSARLNEARNPTAALDAGTIVNADVSATANIAGSKLANTSVTFTKLDDVIDDDTMGTATNTTLATSESIKAYVDAYVDEYAMKYSTSTGSIALTTTWSNWDLSSVIGSNRTLVIFECYEATTTYNLNFRTPGSPRASFDSSSNGGWGASGGVVSNDNRGSSFVVTTDASGIIEMEASTAATVPYRILAYQKIS